ncbi:MAG: tetratricopeptide repeat protein [Rubrobacteraceae bacterium]
MLSRFLEDHPADAEAHYQMAWTFDVRGMEREAVSHYRDALESGFSDGRSGAYIGLGSSLRALGEYEEAVETLRRGASEFPEDRAMKVFLAMALYNVGECREAVEILLDNLAETSSDEKTRAYKDALIFYASRLDKVWE